MSILHRISPTTTAAHRADVVFIHGLGGDPFKTWRHGEDDSTSWPHWLSEEQPEVCVWSLGYPAAPSSLARVSNVLSRKQRDAGHSMPLPERAGNVLDVLAQQGIGGRPLVFICHSLGGLVVKHVLRKSDAARNEAWRTLLSNTRGVMFLATPHAGAELAKLLNAFRGVFGTTVTIAELSAHDVYLHDIYDWYQTKASEHGIETVTYYESRALHGAAKIVSRTSANPGVGRNPVALDEDHLSIAKPRHREAQVCVAASELVAGALGEAVPLPDSAEAENGLGQADVLRSPPASTRPSSDTTLLPPVDFWALPAAQSLIDQLVTAYGTNMDRVRRLASSSGTPIGAVSFQRSAPADVWSDTLEAAYNAGTHCTLLQRVLSDPSVRAHHDAIRRLGRAFGCEP